MEIDVRKTHSINMETIHAPCHSVDDLVSKLEWSIFQIRGRAQAHIHRTCAACFMHLPASFLGKIVFGQLLHVLG